MPVSIPSVAPPPYDSAETALVFARTYLADYIQDATTMAGDIFSDAQPYTLPTLNLAWRKLQRRLAQSGHQRLEDEIDLLAVPVVGSLDPLAQTNLSWNGFWDGRFLFPQPRLPQNFISTLKLSERQAGTTFKPSPMRLAIDGLPPRNKGSWNGLWDWYKDAIYMPGSLISMDLHLEFSAFLPDIVLPSGLTLSQVPIPIMRCAEALGYYMAGIFVEPRGNPGAVASFDAQGDAVTDSLTSANAQMEQRTNIRRIPYWSNRRWR